MRDEVLKRSGCCRGGGGVYCFVACLFIYLYFIFYLLLFFLTITFVCNSGLRDNIISLYLFFFLSVYGSSVSLFPMPLMCYYPCSFSSYFFPYH